jgi:hypothetical protein
MLWLRQNWGVKQTPCLHHIGWRAFDVFEATPRHIICELCHRVAVKRAGGGLVQRELSRQLQCFTAYLRNGNEVFYEENRRSIRQSRLHHRVAVGCTDPDITARFSPSGLQLSGVPLTPVTHLVPFRNRAERTRRTISIGLSAMTESNSETELREALTSFETSVATPIVSGELPDWTDKVQKAWQNVSAQVHYHVTHLHPRQFQEISNEDPALFQQVELLKAEDDAIEQEREKLNQSVTRVATHVPKLEPDEGKANNRVQDLIDEAMGFIVRARKQEVAVQTWYVEAFNRERGGGD